MEDKAAHNAGASLDEEAFAFSTSTRRCGTSKLKGVLLWRMNTQLAYGISAPRRDRCTIRSSSISVPSFYRVGPADPAKERHSKKNYESIVAIRVKSKQQACVWRHQGAVSAKPCDATISAKAPLTVWAVAPWTTTPCNSCFSFFESSLSKSKLLCTTLRTKHAAAK